MGAGSSAYGITGATTSIGGTWVGWSINVSGRQEAQFTYRAPGGEWMEPRSLAPEGTGLYNIDGTAAADGTITLTFTTSSTNRVYVRTLSPTGALSEPQLLSDPEESSGCGDITTGPDGATYLVWCANETKMRVRPAGSSTWGPIETISEQHTFASQLTVTEAGDMVLLYQKSSPLRLSAQYKHAGEETWSTPVTLSGSPEELGFVQTAVDGDGRVVIHWAEAVSSVAQANVAIFDETLGAPATLGDPGLVSANVVTGQDGKVIAAINRTDGMTYGVDAFELARGATTWGPATTLTPAGEFAGLLGLGARADGSLHALMLHGPDFSDISVGLKSRGLGGAWADPFDFDTGTPSLSDGGFVSSDPKGNVVVGWEGGDGAPIVVASDGAGPVLNDLDVPNTASVGTPVAMSVNPLDTWSDVASTTWDLGDGSTATGEAASATYDTPGTYTVTVTATDTLGKATAATREIVVVAPPASEDETPAADEPADPPVAKPPTLLPPTIEALLAAKKVTIDAKVTLKSGKRCTGKAVATTRFGTVTYRTTLTLKTVRGQCRAAGTIKLKKAPSLRTKLRITVSAKTVKTRTLTTKRS